MSSTTSHGDCSGMQEAAAVADFLRRHPDFFLTHTKLLADLLLPRSSHGKTVSLIERQVEVLREQQAAHKAHLEQLVRMANDNEARQNRLMRFIVSLSALTQISALCEEVPRQLAGAFDLSYVSLKFIAGRVEVIEGMAMLSSTVNGLVWLEERLSAAGSLCDGPLPEQSSRLLLDDSTDEVGSYAVVPVNNRGGELMGMIMLGAAEPDRYQPGIDTVFLDLVGTMVSATCWRLGIG